MTSEQRVARTLVKYLGYEEALRQVKESLDQSTKRGNFSDIKDQHFWREVIAEIMRSRN